MKLEQFNTAVYNAVENAYKNSKGKHENKKERTTK